MIAEPDVALTDYGLTILGAWLAWALPATAGSPAAWRVFFASISVAAAAGGTVHGFFPDDHGAAGTLLWTVALLAVGVTALAAWWIGAGLLGPTPARAVRGVAALALLLLFLGARRLLASSGAIGVAAAHGRRRC